MTEQTIGANFCELFISYGFSINGKNHYQVLRSLRLLLLMGLDKKEPDVSILLM